MNTDFFHFFVAIPFVLTPIMRAFTLVIALALLAVALSEKTRLYVDSHGDFRIVQVFPHSRSRWRVVHRYPLRRWKL